MSFLTVRDRRSYDYVKTLDLPYNPIEAFDLAALLPQIYGIPDRTVLNKKVIGVSLCNYERYTNGDTANESRRNREIVLLLRELDRRLENVVFKFFIINGNPSRGDFQLTQETIKDVSFKNEIQVRPYNPVTSSVWNEIADCDFVLTTRLHAGIFACFSDTPFMLVEYHKKCADFLDDVGQDDKYLLNDAEFDSESITGIIVSIIEDQRYHLPKARREMINRSSLNFMNIIL